MGVYTQRPEKDAASGPAIGDQLWDVGQVSASLGPRLLTSQKNATFLPHRLEADPRQSPH